VKRSPYEVAEVPSGVVTVTSTVPVPAGETAETTFGPSTVTSVAALMPKLTAVAPVRLLPKMYTFVPPVSGPRLGKTTLTVGAAPVAAL
jgi:hypothetical protein